MNTITLQDIRDRHLANLLSPEDRLIYQVVADEDTTDVDDDIVYFQVVSK